MLKHTQAVGRGTKGRRAKSQKKPRNFFVDHWGWGVFFLVVIVLILLMLTNNQYSSPGFYGHLSIPGRFMIANFAQYVGGVGMSIIVMTVIVRLCMMPSMVKRTINTTRQSVLRKVLAPQIIAIRKAFATAKRNMKMAETMEDRAKYKAESKKQSHRLIRFYRKHHLGIQNMGCGTILFQIPIFGMLYASIRFSPDIQKSTFLGMPLGKPSIILVVIAFVLYLSNSLIIKHNDNQKLAKKPRPKPKTKQQKENQARSKHMVNIMLFGMPVWIGFITLSTSAGITLYFCVGGMFIIGQQLYLHHVLPKVRQQAKAELVKKMKAERADKSVASLKQKPKVAKAK